MYEIISTGQARAYLVDIYGVDLHDYSHEDYRKINGHAFFLAVTCIDLARRILQCGAIGDEHASRLNSRSEHWRNDAEYIENKATHIRALVTEIDTCRFLLNLAIVPFLPRKGN
jgi:hypothetical protein